MTINRDEKSSREEKLSAHEVAAWLRRHPKFLEQFPDLAVTLVVPRDEGKATSLASYQLEVLRDKNRELTRRLHELFGNAQDNERLAVRTHQLTLALMRAHSAATTIQTLVAVLSEDFQGDQVNVVLFDSIDGLSERSWLQIAARDSAQLAPFKDFIDGNEPLCGRLNADKIDFLFAGQQAQVASVALLPIAGYGMVAVASGDPNRFYPGMGTLFLRLMSEAVATALERFRKP